MSKSTKKFFVVQIDPKGIPNSLESVSSEKDGIDLLFKLAEANGVDTDRDTLSNEKGFFVEFENYEDVSGCWLITDD